MNIIMKESMESVEFSINPENNNNTTVLLHDLPKERDIEGGEIKAEIDWEKTKNEFGTVEYKLFRSPEGSNKILLYIPGAGGGLSDFKQRFVQKLTDQGYDVALVCRNGLVLNEANGDVIDCPERVSLGQEQNQDHIGDLPEYGYSEWTQELACAMEGLNDRYQDFQVVGHSTGGLIGLESIRLLQEKRPDLLAKLTKFVALSGMVGNVDIDDEGNLSLDQSTGYSTEKLLKFFDNVRTRDGGSRIKDSQTLVDESYEIMDRLYSQTKLPTSLTYATVSAEGDKYFSLKHSFDLAGKVRDDGGTIQVWHNRAEQINPHGQRELTPKALVTILETPASDDRFKVIRRSNALGPEAKEENGV